MSARRTYGSILLLKPEMISCNVKIVSKNCVSNSGHTVITWPNLWLLCRVIGASVYVVFCFLFDFLWKWVIMTSISSRKEWDPYATVGVAKIFSASLIYPVPLAVTETTQFCLSLICSSILCHLGPLYFLVPIPMLKIKQVC